MKQGDVLWQPSPELRRESLLGQFLDRNGLDDYQAAWRWSVEDLEGFWGAVWDFFEVHADTSYERVLASDAMPGAEWFPGARLDYAADAHKYDLGRSFEENWNLPASRPRDLIGAEPLIALEIC